MTELHTYHASYPDYLKNDRGYPPEGCKTIFSTSDPITKGDRLVMGGKKYEVVAIEFDLDSPVTHGKRHTVKTAYLRPACRNVL